MVYTEKIPEEQVDFFSKVAFSDRLLSTAVEDNYRFLGGVHETDKGFIMDSSYTRNAYDVEAAKYALEHRGYVGQTNRANTALILYFLYDSIREQDISVRSFGLGVFLDDLFLLFVQCGGSVYVDVSILDIIQSCGDNLTSAHRTD